MRFTTPTPTPSPTPYVHKMDYQKYANIPEGNYVTQPSPEIAQLYMEKFDKTGEATPAALVANFESHHDPNAISGINNDGSRDYGLMQNNSATFDDYRNRMPNTMNRIGLQKYTDMLDAIKNLEMAKITRRQEDLTGQAPWSRWHGWKNYGVTWK